MGLRDIIVHRDEAFHSRAKLKRWRGMWAVLTTTVYKLARRLVFTFVVDTLNTIVFNSALGWRVIAFSAVCMVLCPSPSPIFQVGNRHCDQ